MSLNEWTVEQRAMAIADLYERAAKAMREGRVSDAKEVALRACRIADGCNNPGSHYGNALFFARVERSDVKAAMLAIWDGRPPTDSLPGQLEQDLADARKAVALFGSKYADGQLVLIVEMLRRIGVKS